MSMTVKGKAAIKARLRKESALTPSDELQSIGALIDRKKRYDADIEHARTNFGEMSETYYNYVAERRPIIAEIRYLRRVATCKRSAMREAINTAREYGLDAERAQFIATMAIDLEILR